MSPSVESDRPTGAGALDIAKLRFLSEVEPYASDRARLAQDLGMTTTDGGRYVRRILNGEKSGKKFVQAVESLYDRHAKKTRQPKARRTAPRFDGDYTDTKTVVDLLAYVFDPMMLEHRPDDPPTHKMTPKGKRSRKQHGFTRYHIPTGWCRQPGDPTASFNIFNIFGIVGFVPVGGDDAVRRYRSLSAKEMSLGSDDGDEEEDESDDGVFREYSLNWYVSRFGSLSPRQRATLNAVGIDAMFSVIAENAGESARVLVSFWTVRTPYESRNRKVTHNLRDNELMEIFLQSVDIARESNEEHGYNFPIDIYGFTGWRV